MKPDSPTEPDVLLIGSGIMSANLGALLKRLAPELRIQVVESASTLAPEASDGWHNAGTGHAGICELSYTPEREKDGSVDVRKAIEIFAQFEQSKQFWGYAVASGMIDTPSDFINPIPHISFVHGDEQVEFLRDRHAGMAAHHFFARMEYTTDRTRIADWAPLLTEDRANTPIAATRMDSGTDVNFGVLARKLLSWLATQPGCKVTTGLRVVRLEKSGDRWRATVRERSGATFTIRARFVFIGAGGGSLPLLQSANIPEAQGIGGFPIGGQWLVCTNPDVIRRHHAKVYGQALDAAPTMAVPHLDSRRLEGRRELLFGPFAAWTTKFLHESGHWTDLPRSVRPDNLITLITVGLYNLPLVRYLIQQGTLSMDDRIDVLRIFYPAARKADWKLIDAGIRVQAIKKTDGRAGIVHYGTEVLTDAAGTLSALLGASPGASTSVHIVLQIIERCFPELTQSATGRSRLEEMVPGHLVDFTLAANAEHFREIHAQTNLRLHLTT